MATAKDIFVKPIKSADANAFVKAHHYSGKVAQNSQLHLGVFLNDRLHGVMQFGPSLDKRKIHEAFHGFNTTMDTQNDFGHALLDSLSEQFYAFLIDNKILK